MMLTMPFSSPPAENACKTCKIRMRRCTDSRGVLELLKPEPEHQDVPQMARAVADARLVLVPHLRYERSRQIRILAFQDELTRVIADTVAEPGGEGNAEAHFVPVYNLARQLTLERLLEYVLARHSS